MLSEEIMTLTANEQFQDAAEIADRIDWRKVRSFSMLMKISELYQLNRRYEDALELMLMAYDHNPKSRDIVYSLCELYILLENHVKALEFLALYKRMAPHDPGVYILQYKLQELEGAALEDQIQLLEEFTRKDYREEWVYQLAYLYHRMGFATKCVETCDELLNWFKEGPFVIKTLELKMLHAKLRPDQQVIYDHRQDIADEIEAVESDEYTAEKADPELNPDMKDVDIHVKTIDMGKFNTINLQKALAESMRELMGVESDPKDKNSRITGKIMKPMMEDDYMSTGEMEKQMAAKGAEELEDGPQDYPEGYEGDYPEEGYEGDYPEEGYEGDYPEEGYEGDYPEEGYEGDYPEEGYEGDYPEEGYEGDYPEEGYGDGYAQEGYEGEYTGEGYEEDPIESVPGELASEPEGVEDQTMYFNPVNMSALRAENKQNNGEVFFEDRTDDIVIDNLPSNTNPDYESVRSKALAVQLEEEQERQARVQNIPGDIERRTVRTDKPGMENMFYLGDDGQLGLAVPARPPVEKQITGQIHINEYLSEWEKAKRRQRAKQDEEIHRNLLERTGPIFKDYEESNRNGLIEELEREQRIFEDKYQADDIELRSIDEINEEIAAGEDGILEDAAVTGETAASEDVITGESSGPSIWDEVAIAIEQDKLKENGAVGLVDAAVSGSSSLLDTKSYDVIREITPEGAEGGEETAAEDDGSAGEEAAIAAPAEPAEGAEETPETTAVTEEETGAYSEGGPEAGDSQEEYPETGSTEEEGYAEEGYYDENGNYIGGYYDENDNYIEGYYDESGNYVQGYYDENGNYIEGYYDENGEYIENTYYAEEGDGTEEEYYPEDGGRYGDDRAAEEAGEPGDEEAAAGAEADPYADDEENISGTDNLNAISEELSDTSGEGSWGGGMNTAQIREISGALEADADRVGHETVDEMNDEYVPGEEDELSAEEKKLFADFLYSKKMRSQLLEVIDKISLAAYVGNAIITGDSEESTLKLGKNLIKEIQMIDANFASSRIAKISGTKMNRRDIPMMLNQLSNGALMIDHASEMSRETMETMAKTLESMSEGLFVVMIDKRKEMDRLLEEYEMITGYFNARIDIAPMNNNALVEFAKKYAYSLEYKIDEERGVLALHQRISELQIGEHNVSTREVEDIVDEAIEYSKKHRLAAYFQVLSGKRYDYEDMIILREKDFIHK